MLSYSVVHPGLWGYDLTADQDPHTTVEITVPDNGVSGGAGADDPNYQVEFLNLHMLHGHIFFKKPSQSKNMCVWDYQYRGDNIVDARTFDITGLARMARGKKEAKGFIQGSLILHDALSRMKGVPNFRKLMGRNKIKGKQLKVELSPKEKDIVKKQIKATHWFN